GDRNAAAVENLHGVDESLAFFTQAILVRDETIFENDARRFGGPQTQLVLLLRRCEAGHAFFKDKGGDALTSLRAIARGKGSTRVRVNRVGNKVLRPVHEPAPVVADRRRARA